MVAVVTGSAPTPQEAQASLAEAGLQAAGVRRADQQFRSVLLVIGVTYLAAAGVFSFSGRRGGPFAWLILAIIVLGAAIGIAWLVRIRAFSRTGILWYVWAIAAFNIWNGVLVGLSIATGFWSPTQPAYHFGITVLFGVLPLIVAAYLIGRR